MAKKQNKPTPAKAKSIAGDSSVSGDSSGIMKWAPVILAVLVFLVGLTNQMTGVDDHAATVENPAIKNFSLEALFSNFNLGMYAPVTWMGYAIAHGLGGEQPMIYHFLSLLAHAVSTWLAVRLILRLTGDQFVAMAVGILFAVHPIQVESVAWIAGFSTPLFSMFSLMACHAYLDYVHEGKGYSAYLWAIGAFLLACLSKSAAVTLPLTLMVLDQWKKPQLDKKRLLLGYVPFFLISLGFGLLTIYSRETSNMAVGATNNGFTALERFFLVCYTPVFYWFKLLVPIKLNIYYSFDKAGGALPFYYFLMPLVIAAASYLGWRFRKTAPYIYIGLAFFFANIIVTLPFAAMSTFELRADHYNYIACIGIFYILVNGWLALTANGKLAWLKTAGYAWLVACIVLCLMQVRVWKDTVTVISNSINNGYYQKGMMYFARGVEYGDLGKPQDAIKDFTSALAIDPEMRDAYKFRGSLYAQAGQIDLAVADLERYLKYDPSDVVTWNNMAMIYMRQNRLPQALVAFNKTIELKPDAAISYQNRAKIYEMMGDQTRAAADLQKAKEVAIGKR
jgi:tetratricopeptide (TPR) repeat protein